MIPISFLILIALSAAHALSLGANDRNSDVRNIAVIGGGSSGIFSAIAACRSFANENKSKWNGDNDDETTSAVSAPCVISVSVYEASNEVLGSLRRYEERGNILFDTTKKTREILLEGFPRGKKELASLMSKFPPLKQREWFENHGGVTFEEIEKDGRLFPTTKSSQIIIDTLLIEAENASVRLYLNHKVSNIELLPDGCGYKLEFADVLSVSNEQQNAPSIPIMTIKGNQPPSNIYNTLILATGSSHIGYRVAKSLGHTIVPPVRSLFAFRLQNKLTSNTNGMLNRLLPGQKISAPYVRVSLKIKIPGQKRTRLFKEMGQVEFGRSTSSQTSCAYLSGKAAIKLSSFAARELHSINYQGCIRIHFCPDILGAVEKVEEFLWNYRQECSSIMLTNKCPIVHRFVDYDNYDWETETFAVEEIDCIPQPLWESICIQVMGETATEKTWGNMSQKKIRALADLVVGCPFDFIGRATTSMTDTKQLFINAGGIDKKQVNFTNMESSIHKGLFFCGQILDIDGSYGGFNYMSTWATAYAAGINAARCACNTSPVRAIK